jgi:hypothetical protein
MARQSGQGVTSALPRHVHRLLPERTMDDRAFRKRRPDVLERPHHLAGDFRAAGNVHDLVAADELRIDVLCDRP